MKQVVAVKYSTVWEHGLEKSNPTSHIDIRIIERTNMKNAGNEYCHSTLNKSDANINQSPSYQQVGMLVLTEGEVLSVAGGPEVDIETGGGGG
ncbi:hypothetical protein ACO0K9_08950 [Undibacterium sp. Ji50W]|uniref:hypothetical protein n=1 Tax=Undibacterium sp. Ji50W TaxID=3413041 RepID=UPI003BF31020